MSGQPSKHGGSFAGQLGWGVGMYDWLDSEASQVKMYWRMIEHGSEDSNWPWVGKRIAGLWGSQAGPRGALHGSANNPFRPGADTEKLAPYYDTINSDMLGAARRALWVFLGGGKGPNMDLLRASFFVKTEMRGGKNSKRRVTRLVQATTEAQRRHARQSLFYWFMTQASVEQIPFVQGVVHRPIEPRDYYAKALRSFPLEQRQLEAMRHVFAEAFQTFTGRTDLEVLRKAQARDNLSGRASTGRARQVVDDAGLRRFGVFGNTEVTIAATPTIQSLTREQGRFVNGAWQSALREANERVAILFQEAVVGEMVRGRRPATYALRKATADPRNRYPRDLG